MNKKTLIVAILLSAHSLSAQELISAQGDSYSGVNGNLDFSIGEVVINTGSNGSNDITQGFHQTNWNFLGLEEHVSNYDAIIFPNPTKDVLNISTCAFEKVTYSLYDTQGKLVMQDLLSAEQTPIQLSHLAPGSYSLTLAKEAQNLKTFKLVKTH